MAPFIAMMVTFVVLRTAGWLGWGYMDDWQHALQGGVAALFLLAASARWSARKADLVRMVPPALPRPELLVVLTGWLEIAGAVGLLIPALTQFAAAGLALLLVAMFPANVRAAREGLSMAGKPAMRLWPRTLLQAVFLAAVLLAGFA